MTGRQLYDQAICLLGMEQENVTYLEEMAVGCINQMLSDRMYEHNALCRARGEEGVAFPPALVSLDDEIQYDDMLVCECFPYGLAALLVAEDDRTMFNWLMSEYERRAAYYAPCTLTQIRGMDE